MMWCSQCFNFWDWVAERVVRTRGRVPHNPDHRSWLQRGVAFVPREADDVPCGGLPSHETLASALLVDFVASGGVSLTTMDAVSPLITLAYEAHAVRNLYPLVWNEATADEEVEARHDAGRLDDTALGVALERSLRERTMRREVGFILEGLVFACSDLLQRFCALDMTCASLGAQLDQVVHLADDALGAVAAVFERKVPRVDFQTCTWRGLPRGRTRRR